jgi:hypothetical protein
MSKWAHVENIIIVLVAGALACFVSPWCLLMLMFTNGVWPKRGEE